MLTLALDTSSPTGSIAVLDNQELLGLVSTQTGEIYSSRMFRHLDFLLAELSLRMDQIDLYAVSVGPGSFTGLRVGLTAVKGWAEVYSKPVAAISALEAVASQAASASEIILPVLDARRSQVYYGGYERYFSDGGAKSLKKLSEENVATYAELVTLALEQKNRVTIVTPVLELLSGSRQQLDTDGRLEVQEISAALAVSVGELGYAKFLRGEVDDALSLNANYVRRSDAELHLKS